MFSSKSSSPISLSSMSLFLGLSRSISFSITLRINEGLLIGKLLNIRRLSILEVCVDLTSLLKIFLDEFLIFFEVFLRLIDQGFVFGFSDLIEILFVLQLPSI